VDQRIVDHLADGEVSVGDFVLAGGEVGALVIVEVVGRLVPGVLGNDESSRDESFTTGLLEYPHYTRPGSFRGWEVPEILRSGDHGRIERWRLAQSLCRTGECRPDLVEARGGYSEAERNVMAEFGVRPPDT
jgi:tRNA (guanine37-N1)-methyltransferase